MAAVASTSGSNTGLTRDHAKLQQAIRNLKAQTTYQSIPLDCPNIDYYQADLILNKGDGAALAAAISDAMICAGLTDGVGHEAVAAQLARQAAHRAVDMGERDFRSNLKFLRLVISTMRKLPGHASSSLSPPAFSPSLRRPWSSSLSYWRWLRRPMSQSTPSTCVACTPRILRQPMPAGIRGHRQQNHVSTKVRVAEGKCHGRTHGGYRGKLFSQFQCAGIRPQQSIFGTEISLPFDIFHRRRKTQRNVSSIEN